MPIFARYVGVDYSGAKTPTDRLRGLRVYISGNTVRPPPGCYQGNRLLLL
jgi:hypothetical protein